MKPMQPTVFIDNFGLGKKTCYILSQPSIGPVRFYICWKKSNWTLALRRFAELLAFLVWVIRLYRNAARALHHHKRELIEIKVCS